MPLARGQTRIAADPEEVWALISDLERGPEWSVVTLECQITSDGPLGVGSTYRALSRFGPSKIATEHRIVEWDPPHRMVSQVTKGAESVLTQVCEPDDGGTILTMTNDFALPGGVPSFVGDRLAQRVSNTLSEELARIKQVVEERHQRSSQSHAEAPNGAE